MRILVTGATGFIGQSFVQEVQNQQLLCCVRHNTNTLRDDQKLVLDLNKLDQFKRAMIQTKDVEDEEKNWTIHNSQRYFIEDSFDFVLHSIGMSVNVRKGREYTDQNYDFTIKGFDVSALSFHKVLQSAWKNESMNDYGSIVALSYIAAQKTFPDYNDMAENKAYLESIARSFGYHFGNRNKVRINTISQSPTITTAGSGVKGFDTFFNYADKMSPLGNASAEDCANFCIALFSDLTKSVTMQNIFHDGGFSNTGISEDLIKEFTS